MAKSKKSKAAILDEAPAQNTPIDVAKNLESTKNTDLTPKKKSKRAKKKEVKAIIDDIDNAADESFDMVEAEEEDFVVTGGDSGETVAEGLEVAPKIGEFYGDLLKIIYDLFTRQLLIVLFRGYTTRNGCRES